MTDASSKQRILIVDDEKDLAILYKQRLDEEGFETDFCNDPQNALQMARDFKPDLILLDLMMPHLSGFDALSLFRTTPETSNAKIIVFSALNQPEDMTRAKELGASDYLVKSEATLLDVVTDIRRVLGE